MKVLRSRKSADGAGTIRNLFERYKLLLFASKTTTYLLDLQTVKKRAIGTKR